MKIWVEYFFDRDFTDRVVYTQLLAFLDEMKKYDLQQPANALKLIILRVNKKRLWDRRINRFQLLSTSQQPPKLSSRSDHATTTQAPMSQSPSQSSALTVPPPLSGETKFLDWNLSTVAEQLVLIEFSLFKLVDLKEIANMAWKSESPKKTSPNVINIFNRFDNVSQWTATEIVMAQSPKQRVAIIEKMIALAQKCLEIRNYNSLMEIIAGLNRGSVQRMKKTWETVAYVSRQTLSSLNQVVDSLQNYKNYRDQLRKSVLPCLPYFGIFLRDLTFMDVGNPGKIGEYINFEKIYMTSRILRDIQTYQRTPYHFDDDELQPHLRRLLAMPEELLYKHSQTIEPSSNSQLTSSNNQLAVSS